MPGPSPAVAIVRHAVRRVLADLESGGPALESADRVLVGCSGGPDSLALLAAAAFEGPRLGLRVDAVVVDHGLQPDSAQIAAQADQACRQAGAGHVLVIAAQVAPTGEGPEAAARTARYRAFERAIAASSARLMLLGHTLDDQAEQVLLGLARGSGARSLAGMPARRGQYVRPLLEVPRALVHQACADLGLQAWHDPANRDPRFARNRVRHRVLPVLEDELGPGVAAALARTAAQLAEDTAALDELAADLLGTARVGEWRAERDAFAGRGAAPLSDSARADSSMEIDSSMEDHRPQRPGPVPAVSSVEIDSSLEIDGSAGSDGRVGPDRPQAKASARVCGPTGADTLEAKALVLAPTAIRRRALRAWLADLGCPAGSLARTHVLAVDALVVDWHGQGTVALPGGVSVTRRSGRLFPSGPRTNRQEGARGR